jgi:hypothetical protein
MRTHSQIEASRRNGAQSRGPATSAGKAASAQNATTHGLYAKTTVLASESQADFDELREAFFDRFLPADLVELELLDGMVKTRWLIRRLDRIITTALDFEVDRCIPQVSREIANPDADAFQLRAHEVLTDNRRLESWLRMQESLERKFDRYLRNLTRLQKQRNQENEPELSGPQASARDTSEHPGLQPANSQIAQNEPKQPATVPANLKNHENEPKPNVCPPPPTPQKQQNEPGAEPPSQTSTNGSQPSTPQNRENEPKLISINEAIRRGLIPSLSPRSASQPANTSRPGPR